MSSCCAWPHRHARADSQIVVIMIKIQPMGGCVVGLSLQKEKKGNDEWLQLPYSDVCIFFIDLPDVIDLA